MRDSGRPVSPDTLSAGRAYRRGIWTALTSAQAMVLFGTYVGFGGLIRDIGFPLGAGMLSSVIVFALPAQVILVGGFAAGNAPAAIALAVGLSSVRFLPLTVSVLPYLRGPKASLGAQLFAAHFVAVSVWVEGVRNLPALPAAARLPFFYGLGNCFVLICLVGTVVGYALAGTLPHALAIGLLFLTPVSFLLQLARNARDLVDTLALILGLALAPAFAEFGGRLDLLWTGVVAGTAAFLIQRWRQRS